MLSALNNFIVDCSKSWWKVLLLFAGQTATLLGLQNITGNFPSLSNGDIPFDMQNDLTPAQLFEQLAGWTDAAYSSYYAFQAIDVVFPLVAGLFLAALCAFGLRHSVPSWYSVAVAKNLFVLMLLATLFDYLENVNMIWAVTAWPEQVDIAGQLAVAAKKAKLFFLNLSFGATGLFLVLALLRWIGRKTGIVKS